MSIPIVTVAAGGGTLAGPPGSVPVIDSSGVRLTTDTALTFDAATNVLAVPVLQIAEGSAPANPPTGSQRLYIKSSDHLWYQRDHSGTETAVGGGSTLQVQDEGGSPITARPYLNFIGPKVAAIDNPGATRVDIQIDANVIIPTPAVAGQVTYFVDIDQIGGHTGLTYDDASGQLGTGYLELTAITAPAAPASGFVRLYVDSADGHVKFKKNGGGVIDLG